MQMKYITDCLYYKNKPIYSTYIYSETSRKGAIVYKGAEIETTGTFSISQKENRLIAGNYNNIVVIDLERASAPYTIYDNKIINYNHAEYEGTIYSVGLGCYTEINTKTGDITWHQYFCNGEKCIHDILSVAVDKQHIYIGCDIGCLSYIDRNTHSVLETHSFSGGITWLCVLSTANGHSYSGLEVGTYMGEYAIISERKMLLQKSTGSIIWRINRVEIEGAVYNVIAQSYDGIGIYTEDLILIKHIPTTDLVYTVEIDKDRRKLLGYNYYTGEIQSTDLFNIK
ncbi:hypothetical protein NEPAR04_0793 [Nematocida parisii]|nr:hypothetical protein NEPAR03_2270 [Nematocida parisii]KAI5131011.1 hypothetical protein NEPAR08_2305 [Nematocida parisii]KAI5141223.1 hypothetical protein NEPAR04_0793 [Nematocida parisii]